MKILNDFTGWEQVHIHKYQHILQRCIESKQAN